MSKKYTLRKVNGTDMAVADTDQEPVLLLISMLDRLDGAVYKWDSRLRTAIVQEESGNHVLRVRVDHGRVVKVTHGVEDEM